MQNKFFKIILLIAVISVALFALTYFTRTAIDIGCAKTGMPDDSWKRHFMTVNCWSWERTIQLQQNFN